MMTESLSFADFQRLVPDPRSLAGGLRTRCLTLATTGSAEALLDAALADPAAALRSRSPHITVSSILFDAELAQVALLLHRKRGQWFYPGGHADGDWNWCGAALRECREELAPTNLQLGIAGEDVWHPAVSTPSFGSGPLDRGRALLLPRLVVRHDAVDHEHIDLVYILRTLDRTLAVAPEEGDRCHWFPLKPLLAESSPDPLLTAVTCRVIAAAAEQVPQLEWLVAG